MSFSKKNLQNLQHTDLISLLEQTQSEISILRYNESLLKKSILLHEIKGTQPDNHHLLSSERSRFVNNLSVECQAEGFSLLTKSEQIATLEKELSV